MNKTKSILLLAGLAAATAFAGAACATPILDLNGTPIPTAYQQYTVNFTATQTTTNITFAMRDDPSWIYLDTIVAASSGAPAVNLLTNGGFEGGTYTNVNGSVLPNSWLYLDPYDTEGGNVQGGNRGDGQGGSSWYWYDGAVGDYDALTQAIATAIGDTYQISFWMYEESTNPTFSSANGIDLVVYAGAVPDFNGVPEPASLGMFGLGLLMLGGFIGLRRRQSGALQA